MLFFTDWRKKKKKEDYTGQQTRVFYVVVV